MIEGALSIDALVQSGAALLVGAAHFALIWVGLRQMRTSSEERNRQLDMQAETLGALVRMLDERTAGLTRGIETVIERTGGRGGTT